MRRRCGDKKKTDSAIVTWHAYVTESVGSGKEAEGAGEVVSAPTTVVHRPETTRDRDPLLHDAVMHHAEPTATSQAVAAETTTLHDADARPRTIDLARPPAHAPRHVADVGTHHRYPARRRDGEAARKTVT